MAKVLFGPLITGARGTIAGTTFSANKGGPYAKGWARGPNPQTTPQYIPRSTFARYAIRWGTLTSAQRTSWDTYAALPAQKLTDPLGNDYYASGFNWYLNFNTHRTYLGRPPYDTCGNPTVPATLTPSSIVVNSTPTNNAVVTYPSPPANAVDCAWFVYLAPTKGRIVASNANFLFHSSLQKPDATNPITLANLDDLFGAIQVDQVLWVRTFRQQTAGRRNTGTEIMGVAV
jgi:hypothetical protein